MQKPCAHNLPPPPPGCKEASSSNSILDMLGALGQHSAEVDAASSGTLLLESKCHIHLPKCSGQSHLGLSLDATPDTKGWCHLAG